MKILVPIKRVADPDNANKMKVSADGAKVTSEGLEQKINPFDEYAVEAALRLLENGASGEKNPDHASPSPPCRPESVTSKIIVGAEKTGSVSSPTSRAIPPPPGK